MVDLGSTFAAIGNTLVHVADGVHAASGGGGAEPVDPIFFGFMAILLGVCLQQCLNAYCPRVPYTVMMLVFGIFIGLMFPKMKPEGRIYHSFDAWISIDAHLILYAFLPALLFGDSMGLNFHLVKKCFGQCLILAGPGVAIGGVLVALLSRNLFDNTYWTLCLSLMFGSVLAATDPVAVVGILKSLGVSPKLTTIIAGESLMNDGVAIVMYLFFVKLSLKENPHLAVYWEGPEKLLEVPALDDMGGLAGYAAKFFFKVAILGSLLGFVLGMVFVSWMKCANNKTSHGDTIIQIALSLCCAYLSFFIGEGLLHVSGVLATVVAAVLVGSYGWPNFTSRGFMLEFWHTMEWLFNTILFFLSGTIMGDLFYYSGGILTDNWWKIILLYIGLLVIRGALVGLFAFPMNNMGYGFSKNDALVLIWGGLRGAVGLALAIDIFHKFYVGPCCPHGLHGHCYGLENNSTASEPHVFSGGGGRIDEDLANEECGNLFKFSSEAFTFIAVYALLTLIVNGVSTEAVLQWLGMMKTDQTEAVLLHFTRNAMKKSCTDALEKQSVSLYSETFSEGLTQQIRANVSQLRSAEAGETPKFSESSAEVLKNVAILFFRILRNEYIVQADEGLIRDDVSAPLLESADQTIEAIKSGSETEASFDDFGFIETFLGAGNESSCLTCLVNNTIGLCKGPIFKATSDMSVYTIPEFNRRYDQGLLSFIIGHRRAEQKLTELLGFAGTDGAATELMMQEANRVILYSQSSTKRAQDKLMKGDLDDKKAEQVSNMLFEENRLVIARFQDSGILDGNQAHSLLHHLEEEMADLQQKLEANAERADESAAAEAENTTELVSS